MKLLSLSLAPPGEESALVIVERSERHVYYTERDDQHEAERVLLTGRPFRTRQGQIRRTEGLYAVVHAQRLRATTGAVAEHVTQLVGRRELAGPRQVLADVTDVGRSALDGFKMEVRGVTLADPPGRGVVARRRLELATVAVLEQDRLQIASGLLLTGAMAEEMKSQTGRLRLALLLALWSGERIDSFNPAAWATVTR